MKEGWATGWVKGAVAPNIDTMWPHCERLLWNNLCTIDVHIFTVFFMPRTTGHDHMLNTSIPPTDFWWLAHRLLVRGLNKTNIFIALFVVMEMLRLIDTWEGFIVDDPSVRPSVRPPASQPAREGVHIAMPLHNYMCFSILPNDIFKICLLLFNAQ